MADNRRLSNSSSKALIYYLEGEKRGRPTSGRGQTGPEAGAIDRTDCRSIHNCTREHEENEADRHRRHPSHNIRTSSSNSQSDETPNVVRFNEQPPPPLCVRLDVCSRTRRKSALLIDRRCLNFSESDSETTITRARVARMTGIPSDLPPTPPHRGRNTNTRRRGGQWRQVAVGGGHPKPVVAQFMAPPLLS